MKTATITLANGLKHTCVFRSAIESPWRGTSDPPRRRGPHPQYPQYLIYQDIPGVEHRRIVKQYWFDTVYDDDEWRGYWERGLI